MKFSSIRAVNGYVGAVILALSLTACGLGKSPEERIQEALAYESSGELSAAEIELKNALRSAPDNAGARLILGRVLLAQGQFQAAEKELRRAIENGAEIQDYLLPYGKTLLGLGRNEELLVLMTSAEAKAAGLEYDRLILLASAQLSLGQQVEGEAGLEQAITLRGDLAEPWLLLARSSISAADIEGWRLRIGEALKAEPDSPNVWLEKARVETGSGMGNDARASYTRVLELTGDELDSTSRLAALIGLAESALGANEIAEAGAYFQQIPKKYANTLQARFVEARIELSKGNIDGAESILNSILTASPGHPGATYLMAAINFEQEKFAQAEGRLTGLLESNPNNVLAKRLLALTRLKLDDADQAAADVDALVMSGNSDSYLTAMIGDELLRKGDLKRAVEYLRLSSNMSPDNPAIALELAMGLLAQQEFMEAGKVLDSVSAAGAAEALRQSMRAMVLHKLGKSEEARAAADAALGIAEIDVASMNLVGEYFVLAGATDKARKTFEQARIKDPQNPRSDFSLAVLAFKAGDKSKAKTHLERVVELDPKQTRALIALAQLAIQEGDNGAGMQFLQRANTSDPGAALPAFLLARTYLASGQAQKALDIITPAAARSPKQVQLQRVKASAEMGAGKPQDAVNTLEQLRREHPGEAELMLMLATAQSAGGLHSRARDTLEDVIDLDRKNIRALLMLADVEDRLDNVSRSSTLIKEARTVDPQNPISFVVEGDIMRRRSKLDEAYAAYENAASRGTDRALAVKMFQLATTLGRADADKPLRDWLAKLPDDVAVRALLAQAYLNKSDFAGATREYELIVQSSPNDPVALNNLAWSLFKLDDPRALGIARKAHAVRPDSARITDTLGWILAKQQQLEEAEALLSAAHASAPDDRDIAFHLAFVYSERKNTAASRAILKQITKSGEDFSYRDEAASLLAQLGND